MSNVPNLTSPTFPAASKALRAASPERPAPKVRIVSYPPPSLAATAFCISVGSLEVPNISTLPPKPFLKPAHLLSSATFPTSWLTHNAFFLWQLSFFVHHQLQLQTQFVQREH